VLRVEKWEKEDAEEMRRSADGDGGDGDGDGDGATERESRMEGGRKKR